MTGRRIKTHRKRRRNKVERMLGEYRRRTKDYVKMGERWVAINSGIPVSITEVSSRHLGLTTKLPGRDGQDDFSRFQVSVTIYKGSGSHFTVDSIGMSFIWCRLVENITVLYNKFNNW